MNTREEVEEWLSERSWKDSLQGVYEKGLDGGRTLTHYWRKNQFTIVFNGRDVNGRALEDVSKSFNLLAIEAVTDGYVLGMEIKVTLQCRGGKDEARLELDDE